MDGKVNVAENLQRGFAQSSDDRNMRDVMPALTTSLTPGLLILTVGIVMLSVKMHWIPMSMVYKLWPLVLIVIGLGKLEEWWRS